MRALSVVLLTLLFLTPIVGGCDLLLGGGGGEGEGEGEVLCRPGERICSDNGQAILECLAFGGEPVLDVLETCRVGEVCGEEAGVIACIAAPDIEPSCTIGETRCTDDNAAVLRCSGATNTFVVDETCRTDQVCAESGGAADCVSDVPTSDCDVPGERQCNETFSAVLRCEQNGGVNTLVVETTCTGDDVCGFSQGFAACELPVVEPETCATIGERRCTADNRSVLRCSGATNTFVPDESCRVDQICSATGGVGGVPDCILDPDAPVPCTIGERQCADNDRSVLRCSGATNTFVPDESCRVDQICSATGGVGGVPDCILDPDAPVPCTIGDRVCADDDRAVLRCSGATNSYINDEFCRVDQICSATGGVGGVPDCVRDPTSPVPCTIGDRVCADDDRAVLRCSGATNSYINDEFCSLGFGCEVRADVADCFAEPRVDENCRPGARKCNDNGDAVLSCVAGGGIESFTVFTECSITEDCVLSGGVSQCISRFASDGCTAGKRRCSLDLASVETCTFEGSGFETSDACVGDEVCLVSAGVVGCAVPSAAPVCTAGTQSCDGLDVIFCSADGAAEEVVGSCVSPAVCSVSRGTALCVTPPPVVVCTAGRRFCDGNQVKSCNAAGTGATVFDTCSADEACGVSSGVVTCVPLTPPAAPCIPGSRSCDNNQVMVCAGDGVTRTVFDSCSADEVCGVQAGVTTCINAVPVATCTPGALFCDGAALLQCNSTGTGTTIQDICTTLETCVVEANAAQCVTDVVFETCIPGRRSCEGNQVLTCAANGVTRNVTDTCTADETCGVQSGVTTCIATVRATVCTANRRFCDSGRVMQCNGTGTGATVQDTCTADETCTIDGGVAVCAAPEPTGICVPGTRACDGTRILRCSTAGAFEVFETCGPDELCNVVATVPTCEAPPQPAACTPNTRSCDGTLVLACDASGQQTVADACGAAEVCQAGACVTPPPTSTCVEGTDRCEGALILECVAGREVVAESCDVDEVCAVDFGSPRCIAGTLECSGDNCVCTPDDAPTCDAVPTPGTRTGFLFTEKFFTTCGADPTITTCAEGLVCEDGIGCTSSVLDESSPYYSFSCPLVQQLANPTALDADCRCFINQATSGPDVCDGPSRIAAEGFRQGSGPSMVGVFEGRLNGGIIDGDELVVATQWGGSSARRGLLLGVNKNTGNRRIVSGEHPTATVGAGPPFAFAIDVKKGADNNYYVLSDPTLAKATEIVRVTPATGARTLVWRGNDSAFGQCLTGDPTAAARGVSLQYTDLGFALDGAGNFYLGYANPITDGRGIVRISANGLTCTTVTAHGTRPDGFTKGTGAELGGFVQGFALEASSILAFTTQPKQLLRIDLASGNRTVIVRPQSGGIIGERWVLPDTGRNLLWTVGFMNSTTITAVDESVSPPRLLDVFSSCGDEAFPFFPICLGGPLNINSLNYGGVFLDSTSGRLFFSQDAKSIVEFELATGNSIIHSL
jgi:hypothetical protein